MKGNNLIFYALRLTLQCAVLQMGEGSARSNPFPTTQGESNVTQNEVRCARAANQLAC